MVGGYQCAAASGVRDGSRPPATGLQEQVANHRKRLWSRAMVVSVTEKVLEKHQVRIKKTNASEPPLNCRKLIRWRQNWGVGVAPGRIWRRPANWPGGARHRGGVSLIRALTLNCGNLSQR